MSSQHRQHVQHIMVLEHPHGTLSYSYTNLGTPSRCSYISQPACRITLTGRGVFSMLKHSLPPRHSGNLCYDISSTIRMYCTVVGMLSQSLHVILWYMLCHSSQCSSVW